MKQLTMGWNTVPLADTCELFTDGNWIESKDQSSDGIRLIQTGNVGNGNFKNRRSKARWISPETFDRLKCQEIIPGDCLVSRLPDPVGRSCILPVTGDKMITAVDCSILRFNRTILLSEFFNYFSQSRTYLSNIESKCSGATRKRISRKNLGLINIPCPPLPEQKRIVAILDEAFAGIRQAVANAEKNLANARELFESYLNNVFTQKGEEWVEKMVSEIADCCLGKMLDKKKNKGSAKPYLRNLNVRWFDVNLDDLQEMRFEESEEERFSVGNGDLVICEGGYPGRAAIWKSDKSIYFQKAIHRVRAKNPIHNRWLLYFLYLSDVTGDLRQYFTGAGIQHFTGQSLKRFRLPIAPPEEISHHLKKFDSLFEETKKLETLYQQKLTALTELKQSILQKAFSGQLTAAH